MNVQKAYDQWSDQYDTNSNRTRDLEAITLQTILNDIPAESILEVGCGTGKNTTYLLTKAKSLLAVDLSEAMLEKAKAKTNDAKARFVQANIKQEWSFTTQHFDVITFSLVLEHIENLEFVFTQAAQKLAPGGYVYVGELHPYKQYAGTKARFDTDAGRTEVECYTHNISEFVQAAKKAGLQLVDLREFFDAEKGSGMPRILTLLFKKA